MFIHNRPCRHLGSQAVYPLSTNLRYLHNESPHHAKFHVSTGSLAKAIIENEDAPTLRIHQCAKFYVIKRSLAKAIRCSNNAHPSLGQVSRQYKVSIKSDRQKYRKSNANDLKPGRDAPTMAIHHYAKFHVVNTRSLAEAIAKNDYTYTSKLQSKHRAKAPKCHEFTCEQDEQVIKRHTKALEVWNLSDGVPKKMKT
ncbi:hypothetical protein [Parasitella parasitica]|uniref:Uncharacterized protein n=1 Tax=Parasitella parasitica TaxID=35722 RepID=A0A0B7MZU0_9FUNG|nr:hypothetical protein [Parasitella parasitica]